MPTKQVAPAQVDTSSQPLATPYMSTREAATKSKKKEKDSVNTCVKAQALIKSDQEWASAIGSPVDESGELLQEYQYLSDLPLTELERLGENGYASAMAAISERLMFSEKKEDVEKARLWAHKSALNGIIAPLPSLAVSYLYDYQKYNDANNVVEAEKSLVSYHAILSLFEHIVPGSLSNSPSLVDAIPLNERQRGLVDARSAKLINSFSSQREALGFDKLSVTMPDTVIDDDIILCDE